MVLAQTLAAEDYPGVEVEGRTMNEMTERVARAMYERTDKLPPVSVHSWETVHQNTKTRYRRQAEAALRAIALYQPVYEGTMIERVAQAVEDVFYEKYKQLAEIFSDQSPEKGDWKKQIVTARAAILAMRSPTVRMLTVAEKTLSHHPSLKRERVPSKEKHRIRYEAMIDEALKE